jgi:Protein of unknown function (DUF2961)
MTDAGAFLDPVRIDPSRLPRTISFENPEGSAGSAGASGRRRKGSPSRTIEAGERVVLADIDGPGIVGHFWLTVPPMRPERLRAIVVEMYYDGSVEPSVAVPLPDFFGAVHGRPGAYASALQSIQEGRGCNSWIPMPFRGHLRVELTNHADREVELYYQLDLTVGPVPDDVGLLHASFRRQNPTVLREDFVIADGFTGPGRFLGCNVGVRVLQEPPLFTWYGEGEVKMYLDDDDLLPTWCGTGLEDYVGTAWGMGAHQTQYQGVPLDLAPSPRTRPMPDLVSFYRWHVPDPISFERRLRVTIQQLGAVMIPTANDELKDAVDAAGIVAGGGWRRIGRGGIEWFAVCERVDDYCATAYVACRDAQPVPRVDVAGAVADIGRLPYEQPSLMETMLGV